MSAVSGILLAAGESRRMAGINKLMLPVDGQPLLRRTVLTLQASRLTELVVVLGHEMEKAKTALAGLDVRTVYNADYRAGQMSSVHCGLSALVQPCDGVMICLTDQPLLTTQDIDALIELYVRSSGAIVVPTYQERRGNPIVLAAAHRERILADGRNLGCKKLIENHPELVTTAVMDNDHFIFDLDTPEDIERLNVRLAEPPMRTAVS